MTATPVGRGSDVTLHNLERAVEKLTNTSAEILRSTPIDEHRNAMKKRGIIVRFLSRFPFIGRGNIMRDKILDHDAVERQFEESVR